MSDTIDCPTLEIQDSVKVANVNRSLDIWEELSYPLAAVVDLLEGKDNLAKRAINKAQSGDISEIMFCAIESVCFWLGEWE